MGFRVSENAFTRWGAKKMPRAKKRQGENRQLLAAEWSIFAERRRRYFSAR